MDADTKGKPHAIWTVVFKRAENPQPIHALTHPDFQHVFAMKRDLDGDFWVVVDTNTYNTEVSLEPTLFYPTARAYCPDAVEIVTVRVNFDEKVHNKQLGVMSCVDTTKAVLGIKDTFCLTPYKLYKNLIRGKYVRCYSARQERGKTSS